MTRPVAHGRKVFPVDYDEHIEQTPGDQGVPKTLPELMSG